MSQSTFPPVSPEQWQAKATQDLGGRPLAKLSRQTLDGIELPPLFRQAPEPEAGRIASQSVASRWRTIQELRHADPRAANLAARRDLELGADGLRFVLDRALQAGREPGADQDGLMCDPADALDVLLEGIDPRRTPVFIDAGLQAPEWIDRLEEWIDNLPELSEAEAAGHSELGRGAVHGGVIYDPLAALVDGGSIELDLDAALARMVDTVLGMRAGLLGVSTCPYHDAGASAGHELALALASCGELLRRGQALELEISDLVPAMVWTLPLSGRPFEAIAKLRAARVIWAKFCVAAGLGEAPADLWIHATSSRREWTRRGPWVNLLRGTVGSFAAAIGGADAVATGAFDGLCGPEGEAVAGLGRGSELGRRLALNTQMILRAESHLDRVVDPARGSYFVETLTDALAREAWRRFQAIEAEGGLVAGLRAGTIQAAIADTAASLTKQAATRRRPLTGLSTYPVLDDQSTPDQAPNRSEAETPAPARTGPVLEPGEITPLTPLRLASAFEALRDRSEGEARPQIHACTLGSLANHQARLDFASNAFRAGGIELVASEGLVLDGDPESWASQASEAMAQSGCKLAIICGRDDDYAKAAATLVAALRKGGAREVWVAGRPKYPKNQKGEELPWGLDPAPRFVHLGCDLVAELDHALTTGEDS